MPYTTSGGTYLCVFCALDAHFCYGCGEITGHAQAPYCGPECRARYLRGDGWLSRCAVGGCEEPTYTRHEQVCWVHLPETHPDPAAVSDDE